jgi:hypothetical protein
MPFYMYFYLKVSINIVFYTGGFPYCKSWLISYACVSYYCNNVCEEPVFMITLLILRQSLEACVFKAYKRHAMI